MRSVAYDHFYAYEELTDTLRTWSEEASNLCALESIGKSYEGRDIWLVTVTNTETGAHLDKPGFLIEANIHSMEWTGCTAALHLVHRLLVGHGKDDLVTRALDTRVFYVIPRLNPDGAERGLEERRFIRSSVRPYPRADHEDGLRDEDVDGDGRVLYMRVEDPNGAWRPHPEERKLLVRREPVDSPEDGPFYRLLPEGRIENYDGVTIKVPPPLEGLDLNRNFPAEWVPEHEQRGAGPYPTSEPEVRAMVAAVTERPNITGHIAYHTFSGVHLRPYAGRSDDDFPTSDLRAYKLIGERGTELTGYPAVSVFHDFKYEPKQTIKGGAHDWMYDHLGVFSWTTEFWSPQRQAGHLRLPLHRLDQRAPDRGRPQADRVGEEELPGRLRRLVRVRPSRARQGRARRLGHHQLLVQRSLRPAGGRGRAAHGVGALPSPRLAVARSSVARRREAGGELVPPPPRLAELRVAADECDGESRGTEGRSRARGRARAAGRRQARRR